MKQEKVSGGEITNYGDNPRKKLLAVTLVTVLSIVAVVSVYAILIGSFTGGEVNVIGTGSGDVVYSLTNADPGTWLSTISPANTSVSWYSRLNIGASVYTGPVTITWQLQTKTGTSTWADVSGATTSTSMVLSGSAQNIYATSDGLFGASNHNWQTEATAAGTYRVVVTVNTA